MSAQYISGDEVLKGTRKISNPPVTHDIEWTRQIYALDLFHEFTPNIAGGVSIPYFEQDIDNQVTGVEAHASGIGDVNIYTLLTPWEDPEPHDPHGVFSLHNVVVYAGLSIPTGDPLAGEVPALHGYHLGSGSVEFKFSGKYFAPLTDSLSLFGAATVIIDGGPDTIDFRYGTSWDFQLNATYEVLDGYWAYSTFFANVREKDLLSNTRLPDTGGTWWYVELGVVATLVEDTLLDVSVFIPVYWNVNGIQPVSDEIWSIGLRYRF